MAKNMPLEACLEAYIEHFCGMLAKYVAGGLWRLILIISGASGQMAFRRILAAQMDQLLDEFHTTVFLKMEFSHDVKFGNGVVSRSGALYNGNFQSLLAK